MISAPAGTPKAVIDRLHQAMMKMAPDEAFQKDLLSVGFDPASDPSPQYATQFIVDELARWRPIVKETGLGTR